MFTRQHYAKIADLIRNFDLPLTDLGHAIHCKLVVAFIELFEEDSSKFSKEKFTETIYRKGE